MRMPFTTAPHFLFTTHTITMRHLIFLFSLTLSTLAHAQTDSISQGNQSLLKRFFEYATQNKISQLPVNERIAAIGCYFIETPYAGGTLDINEQEQLVVNLREFDCVTFVDNVLALALMDKYDKQDLPQFLINLKKIRYRNGKITDYTTRLHYSSDWLHEMEHSGIIEDVTKEKGGIPFTNKVSFISRNWQKYPALQRDTSLVKKMMHVEKKINNRHYYYIPKEKVLPFAGQIKTGDIILITTQKKGLDTSHVGIAVEKNGQIHLLHASISSKKVALTEETLPDYLQRITSHSGIMIGRPVNFKSN